MQTAPAHAERAREELSGFVRGVLFCLCSGRRRRLVGRKSDVQLRLITALVVGKGGRSSRSGGRSVAACLDPDHHNSMPLWIQDP